MTARCPMTGAFASSARPAAPAADAPALQTVDLSHPRDVVVFDLGGVLIDWNPRHLYRKLIPSLLPDEATMERFLAEVCNRAWIDRQDAGRPYAEAIPELIAQYPEQAELIRLWFDRWAEMCAGPMPGMVEILRELKAKNTPLYALSNFSADTFVTARALYDWLDLFDDIVLSAEVGFNKPHPRIYWTLLDRHKLDPKRCVFIDDLPANLAPAAKLGIGTIQHRCSGETRALLTQWGLL